MVRRVQPRSKPLSCGQPFFFLFRQPDVVSSVGPCLLLLVSNCDYVGDSCKNGYISICYDQKRELSCHGLTIKHGPATCPHEKWQTCGLGVSQAGQYRTRDGFEYKRVLQKRGMDMMGR